ncbi:hypothetical protein AYX13_07010 [Cryptococcus neoformans]|nr:hypothetical protein AYX13_07010 [Cryptococcus neoformans var. grubii]
MSAKPAASSLTNHVLNRCLSWLDKVSENATRKAPATHSGLFKAVVMSTGGIVSRETADEMRRWRREMGPMAFEGMMKKISLELVRARARTFAIQRALVHSAGGGSELLAEARKRATPPPHTNGPALWTSACGPIRKRDADEGCHR